jgi:hypothetical protein
MHVETGIYLSDWERTCCPSESGDACEMRCLLEEMVCACRVRDVRRTVLRVSTCVVVPESRGNLAFLVDPMNLVQRGHGEVAQA